MAGRRLHPRVERQDPERRQRGARGDDDGGGDVHPAGNLVHAEQHHAEERGLEEERGQHLVGEQRPGDVAHLVHVAGPVGAELEAHDDARHHAHREGEREDLHPELVGAEPRRIARALVAQPEHHQQPGEADADGREQDVEGDVQPELDAGEEQRFFHTAYYTGALKTQEQKAAAFRALHERAGAFIIPNPWDAGTAKLFAALGFEALATTSLGVASSLGQRDGAITLRQVLDNCAVIAGATELPVSADLENSSARDPRDAAQTMRLAAEAGVVGGSIEDSSGDERAPIYDFQLAVERVQAAAEMARSLVFPFVLIASVVKFFFGYPVIVDTIRFMPALD